MPSPSPASPATKPYKAVVAFVVTLLGTLWANLQGREDLATMGLIEWLTVIVPTVLASAAVYSTSNPPA